MRRTGAPPFRVNTITEIFRRIGISDDIDPSLIGIASSLMGRLIVAAIEAESQYEAETLQRSC